MSRWARTGRSAAVTCSPSLRIRTPGCRSFPSIYRRWSLTAILAPFDAISDGRWRMLIGRVSTSYASGFGGITRKIGSLAKNTTPSRMACTSHASFSDKNSPDRRFDEGRPCAEARIAVSGRIRPCQLSRGFPHCVLVGEGSPVSPFRSEPLLSAQPVERRTVSSVPHPLGRGMLSSIRRLRETRNGSQEPTARIALNW